MAQIRSEKNAFELRCVTSYLAGVKETQTLEVPIIPSKMNEYILERLQLQLPPMKGATVCYKDCYKDLGQIACSSRFFQRII